MPLRSLITYLFCFLIGTVQASESTDGEQQFYDRGRIINKLESKAYSSEEMLRKIWRKLVDIERRVSYLERTRDLSIDNNLDHGIEYEEGGQRSRKNESIYKLDRNTKTLNEAGFFILE